MSVFTQLLQKYMKTYFNPLTFSPKVEVLKIIVCQYLTTKQV